MAATKKETGGSREAWQADEAERTRWEAMRLARDRDDLKVNDEFSHRQGQLRSRLVELYDRRSQLQNQLESLQYTIRVSEEEQERLASEFERHRARVAEERREEDRAHQAQFDRARQDPAAVSPASAAKRTNGRRASNRDMSAQQNAAAASWTSINGTGRRKTGRRDDDEEELPADPGNMVGAYAMEDQEMNGGSVPLRNITNRSRAGDDSFDDASGLRKKDEPRVLKPKNQRHSLPGFTAEVRSPMGRPPKVDGFEDNKVRSPAGRRSLPAPKLNGPSTPEEPMPIDASMEITRENLILKHNGTVYTEPEMYAGIPLERIDEKHPYWETEWQPLEEIINPQLEKWNEKLDNLRRQPDAVRHTVFLANRQVNRGASVIKFLQDGDFHPYQFVGKDMMAQFYKTFINYDTQFRLANVAEELKKFDLDVTPLEWLRHRMYEIAMDHGQKFSLSKITHDLYHDSKLKYLREKHGFGNIGRPSGYKLGSRDPAKAGKEKEKEKPKRQSLGGSIRKKGRRSIGQVDADESITMDDYKTGSQPDVSEPSTPRMQKRQRLELAPAPLPPPPPAPEPEPVDEELVYDGYTSTDSFSAGRIMHLDWRVYQIKTLALTTSTEVTQYWTWRSERQTFEHQVLRDVHPKVTWGIYQKPINFDIRVDEIVEIQFASNIQKIVVIVKNEKRGNVMAHLKRERTKRRFLSFAKKRNIKLAHVSPETIEEAWTSMVSETLPDEDSSES